MVDDGRRTTDGRTPDHGHPISSPCEPDGSGELKIKHAYLSELLTGDTSNDIISPGGSDGGEINS